MSNDYVLGFQPSKANLNDMKDATVKFTTTG